MSDIKNYNPEDFDVVICGITISSYTEMEPTKSELMRETARLYLEYDEAAEKIEAL